MKIAQVVCVYPPYAGGIGRVAQKLQKILSERFDSSVFTLANKLDSSEDRVIRLKTWLRLGHGAAPFSLLKKLKPFDLIYFHYPFFGAGLVLSCFKLLHPEKKLILHYHMDVKQKNIFYCILSWPEKLVQKLLFRQSDLIISASLDYVRHSQIKRLYQKYRTKFLEIPFSINCEEFKPNENYDHSENIILFVGGLDRAHYFKGVDLLIRALASIPNSKYRLKIAGQGELTEKYRRLAEKLKIGPRTEFLGKLKKEDLIANYQKAKVLVLPSINSNEAFGLVLIEALACGTPVIASNLPGVRSVFTDHQSGFLFKTGNVKDLKDKIEKIMDNELNKKMRLEARQLALNKYDEKLIADKILTSINNL